MKFSFEQKIRMAFLLSLVCMLWLGGWGYWYAKRSIATYRAVDEARQVRVELESTWIGVLNAETAARGYARTGDEFLLKTYQSGLEAVANGRQRMRRLTADSPEQQKNLEVLESLLDKKLQWMEAAIQDRREHRGEAAPTTPTAREEDEVTNQIRNLVAAMQVVEGRLVEAQSARAQAEARMMMVMLVLSGAMAVLLVGVASGLIERGFRNRQRAEAERDRFFSLSRDLMCIAGFDGYFKTLNPVWERVVGFSRAELLAQPFMEFIHPEDRAATQAQTERLAKDQEVSFFENRYRCKDGGYRWLSWSARPVLQEKLIYATARDVTEQKQTQEEIAQLNEALRHRATELEAANKELEAFSYSVSHDLRAPLRHLGGFVDLLQRRAMNTLDERSRRHLECIAGSAQQMGRLVDDLLSFSRMARSEMRQNRVNLEELVMEVRFELRRDLKERVVEWKVAPLPEVYGDPPMLRMALMNLMSNAVKYTRPRKSAVIEIGSEANESEHTIFVRDNGVGFDMKYAGKLFGVFQRLHYEDEFEGAGIGLASVQRIIGRHGGRTWAEGKEGEGATFYFTLPKVPDLIGPITNSHA